MAEVAPREVGERWCRRVDGLLWEYLGGELDARAGATVAAHLARCPSCDRAAAGLALVVGSLRRLGAGRRARAGSGGGRP